MIQEKRINRIQKMCRNLEHLFLKESLHILMEEYTEDQIKKGQDQYQDQQQYELQQQYEQQQEKKKEEKEELEKQQQKYCQPEDQQLIQKYDLQQEQPQELNKIHEDQIQYDIKVEIIRRNICEEQCDAIVNAANKQLWEGGGVCGFIFRACGSESLRQKCIDVLKKENKQYIRTSEVVITESCKLAEKGGAKWIIHAAGPIWKLTKSDQGLVYDKCINKLRLTLRNILDLAFIKNNFTSISIPAISSGVYGFPKDICAKIFYQAIEDFKQDIIQKPNPREIVIRLCNFDHETTGLFEKEFKMLREFE